MALSGTVWMGNQSGWEGKIEWYADQNISANTSTISAHMYARKDDGYTTQGSGAFKASLTVGGNTIDCTSAAGLELPGSGDWVYFGTNTTTIRHNSDGSVGVVSISGSITGPNNTSLANRTLSGSGTATLDKIPRGSTISSAGSVYFGSACKVVWTPLATTFYYKLKFTFGSWSYTTSAISPGTTSSYTYAGYTIPYTAANQIPNAVSGTMTVALYSYDSSSCSNQIGSTSTKTFTVTLPDSVVPTISSCTVTLDNSANSVVAGWGIALAGHTKVNLKIASGNVSGIYGSTITGFNISGSYTKTLTGSTLDYTGGVISSSGNKQFKITCTDSRGRTSSAYTTGTTQFLPYTSPKVKKLSMSKNDSGKMVATAVWEYNTVNGYNSVTAKVYYKTTTATDWAEHSGTLTNSTAFTLSDFEPSETASYNFKVVVTDAVGNSAERDAFSSTTTVLLDFKAGGDGLGVGKICEGSQMEVSMDAIFFNEIFIKNNQTTLEDYIRSVMKVLSDDMYGGALPSSGEAGQIFFKRI